MKLLTPIDEFNKLKFNDLVTLECDGCHQPFRRKKTDVSTHKYRKRPMNYCSKKCYLDNSFEGKETSCAQCHTPLYRMKSRLRKQNFCNRSCACLYRNANKKSGDIRSKLEKWLESELKIHYPKLDLLFNDRQAIGAELDIFIPSLKLAFELNGIMHYEPIYGLEDLSERQKRDRRKMLTCAENGIELCVIDTTQQKYFKESSSVQFLKVIMSVINQSLGNTQLDTIKHGL